MGTDEGGWTRHPTSAVDEDAAKAEAARRKAARRRVEPVSRNVATRRVRLPCARPWPASRPRRARGLSPRRSGRGSCRRRRRLARVRGDHAALGRRLACAPALAPREDFVAVEAHRPLRDAVGPRKARVRVLQQLVERRSADTEQPAHVRDAHEISGGCGGCGGFHGAELRHALTRTSTESALNSAVPGSSGATRPAARRAFRCRRITGASRHNTTTTHGATHFARWQVLPLTARVVSESGCGVAFRGNGRDPASGACRMRGRRCRFPEDARPGRGKTQFGVRRLRASRQSACKPLCGAFAPDVAPTMAIRGRQHRFAGKRSSARVRTAAAAIGSPWRFHVRRRRVVPVHIVLPWRKCHLCVSGTH